MPVVVAVQVWYWMTNFQNGVLNYALTQLHLGDYYQHDWYATTFSKLAMVTLADRLGRAAVRHDHDLRRARRRCSRELVEAAEIDGAGPLRVFRDVTFPILKPILLILTSLSIIWDFGVFTQPYLLIGASHVDASNYLMGVYVYIEGYAHSNFGRGAAISMLMLVMVAAMSVSVRPPHGADGGRRRERGVDAPSRAARRRRRAAAPRAGVAARSRGWNAVGLLVFVVLVFPVYWMISTSFKPDDEINSLTPTWFPFHPTLAALPRRDGPAVLLGRRQEQPDHRGRRRRRLDGARVPRRRRARQVPLHAAASSSSSLMIGILMLPQAGLIIPLYVVLARYHLTNTLTGVILTYLTFVLPFAVWTLRGFIIGIPKELEEAAMVDGSSRLGAFVRILLPLVAPGLVATSVFAFVTTWNEYIFASVLLSDQSNQTVTVWLSYFYGTSRNTDWGALMAASTLTAIPVVVFFLLVQRRIAFGLTAGAVKG